MVARALRIVVVSEDRQYLRNGYDFFVACGYEVETQCDTIYRETDRSKKNDLLIYDYLGGQSNYQRNNIYKIAVVAANRPDHVRQAISEGADDVVVRPVTPAKLLVRIRAAAAILESRVTLAQQFGRDPRNNYPGEGAFLGTLQQTIEEITVHGHCVCATMFSTSTEDPQRYQAWLQDLVATALPDSRIFELSDHRVAVVTPATTPEQVSDWAAERLASASVSDTTSTDQPTLRVSGSFVTTRNETTSSQQMALVLNDRLHLALSLGEGLLIDEPNENQWLAQQPTGSIFDGMRARDIMRPTTVELPDTESVSSALEKMRLWNADIAPVLNCEGQPSGLIRIDDLVEVEDTSQPISRHCLPNVPKVAWDANFEEFVALFSTNDSSWLEVLQDNHPVGVIHCDDLTSMNTPVMVSLP